MKLAFLLTVCFLLVRAFSVSAQIEKQPTDSLFNLAEKYGQQRNYTLAKEYYKKAYAKAKGLGKARLVEEIESRFRQLPFSWKDGFRFLIKYKRLWFIKTVSQIIFALVSVVWIIIQIKNYFRDKNRDKKIRERIPSHYNNSQIKRVLKYYVPTYWQSTAPSMKEELIQRIKAIPHFMNKVFRSKTDERYFLVLGDSGMGKTTLLINLFFKAQKKRYNVELLHIALSETWQKIEHIKSQNQANKTILLLDAFDEDASAVENYQNRLHDIILKTQTFFKVIITSRTQFFPSEKEIVTETKIRVDQTYHNLHHMYISPFNDRDIKKYLSKRYGPLWFWNYRKKQKSKKIVKKSPNLMVRPMILDWVEYLIKEDRRYRYTFEIYETMVARWIDREADRVESGRREKFTKDLSKFSREIAIYIYQNSFQGNFAIPNKNIEGFAQRNSISLSELELKSRSLLNRNADGYYKFAHKSILEYFLALEVCEGDSSAVNVDLKQMTQTQFFINEMILPTLSNLKGSYKSTQEEKTLKQLIVEKQLENVWYLNLSDNALENIDFLKKLSSLTYIDLNNNQISSLKVLQEANQLTHLILNDNQIEDLQPLSSLSKLEYLELSNNNIQDLQPLHNLKQLRKLNLIGNSFSTFQRRQLRAELPSCEILFQEPLNYKGHKERSTFIFTIGSIGSGTSTLGASLCYNIQMKKDIMLQPNLDDISGMQYLYVNWLRRLANGSFPPRTDVATIEEIDIALRTKNNFLTPHAYTFVETAMEHFRSINPNYPAYFTNKLNEDVLAYLKRSNILLLIISSDILQRSQDDAFIGIFLKYLKSLSLNEYPKKFIYIVLSKWDLVLKEYGNNTKRFIQENLPNLNKSIEAMKNSDYKIIEVFPFSIGDTEVNLNGEKIIKKYDRSSADSIWRELWQYGEI